MPSRRETRLTVVECKTGFRIRDQQLLQEKNGASVCFRSDFPDYLIALGHHEENVLRRFFSDDQITARHVIGADSSELPYSWA